MLPDWFLFLVDNTSLIRRRIWVSYEVLCLKLTLEAVINWLIHYMLFYAVSAIFQPYCGGVICMSFTLSNECDSIHSDLYFWDIGSRFYITTTTITAPQSVCLFVYLFVCLFVWRGFVLFENFLLIWRCHYYRWQAANFNQSRHFWPLSSEGSSACHC